MSPAARADRSLRVLITAVSPCVRGHPITIGRGYGQLPIANSPLFLRQLASLDGCEVIALVGKHQTTISSLIPEREGVTALGVEGLTAELLSRIDYILPGDIFLMTLPGYLGKGPSTHAHLLVTQDPSEEEAAFLELLKAKTIGVHAVREVVPGALRVNYPWELLDANQAALKTLTGAIAPLVVVEENVTFKGEISIGKGTLVRAGSYLEGPIVIGENCEIGPMAHIRPETAIGDSCRIGKTEVVDCVIMQGTTSKHHAYLGHSVLAERVNVGAFTVTADYRHDAKEHQTIVHGERIETKRKKLGAFLGDSVHTGISTSFYPGRKVWPRGSTLPGEIVTKDKLG